MAGVSELCIHLHPPLLLYFSQFLICVVMSSVIVFMLCFDVNVLFGVFVSPALQTLYTYPDSFRAAKALIAAQYSGASVRVISEPPEFVIGETNRTPEFLAKFPLGKVTSHYSINN